MDGEVGGEHGVSFRDHSRRGRPCGVIGQSGDDSGVSKAMLLAEPLHQLQLSAYDAAADLDQTNAQVCDERCLAEHRFDPLSQLIHRGHASPVDKKLNIPLPASLR